MTPPRAIIIGAGPAGLTAAYELLTRTDIHPIVLESSTYMGGLSRTVNYKGNRIDIGGHRFFSKSPRVMKWWLEMLPVEASDAGETAIRYHRMEQSLATSAGGADPNTSDRVMLLRPRKSRIYYGGRLFDYPISPSLDTLRKLGWWRSFKIGSSYLRSALRVRAPEENLEQFFINRFGAELYRTFFQSYTEKVWGLPCGQISAEWGAQRIKGLSMRAALAHAVRKVFTGRSGDVQQKSTETSLIEQFLYPKFGPGQMWDEVARHVREMGGEIHTGYRADRLVTEGWMVKGVEAVHAETGARESFQGDYFFSTAPVKELVRAFDVAPPANVLEVADGLVYRDFIMVGLLVKTLRLDGGAARDNWIYVQDAGVQMGRLQIFNNWSPFLVADPATVWIGAEYFCNRTDEIWSLPDDRMIALACEELARIGIIDGAAAVDGTVVRVEKSYPAYFGTYHRFGEIREHVDRYSNLFLIGRNGMHRYNNQDHSMLTAMMAVDDILAGKIDKSALWEVNTEMDYHESAN